MFRLPDETKRLTVTGRTGSGKTVFGAWVLSEASFDQMPWIVLDFKGDELLSAIPGVKQFDIEESIPDEPGVYYTHPAPNQDTEINDFMWRVWGKGSTGLFIDEGYMVPNPLKNNGLKAVLTQGRALRIPVITLSQRPSGVNRHVFSEADMFACYHLNDKNDRDRVSEMTPDPKCGSEGCEIWDQNRRLPDYHSRWYDVGLDWSTVLKPVRAPEILIERFRDRLVPKKETIDNAGQIERNTDHVRKIII